MSILNDFKSYSRSSGSRIKTFSKVMFYSCVLFRISHVLYKINLVPLSRFFWLLNRVIYSIDIDPRATIKGGLLMLHGVGIVIGKSVLIKGDIRIYQGATLGGNNGKNKIIQRRKYSQPIIGNDVVIGINACVLGPVVLGDNSFVGANAVVTKDVGKNNIVVSNNKILN